MSAQPHDFTRAPRLPPDVKSRLGPWLNRANSIFSELLLPLGMSLQALSLDQNTRWPLEALDEWTGKPLGIRAILNGRSTILAVPNRLARSLVAALLGDSAPQDGAERDLSPVETSLCELVLATFVDSLREAWSGERTLTVELSEIEPNLRRSKVFRPSDPLVVCRSTVNVLGKEHLWSWLVGLETLFDLFGAEVASRVNAPSDMQRQQIASLVQRMMLSMTVKLGQASLTAPQLAELQVGDVVMLNQRTSDPLRAFLSGSPAFLGWPGRLGEKQAFQIEADLAQRQDLGRKA